MRPRLLRAGSIGLDGSVLPATSERCFALRQLILHSLKLHKVQSASIAVSVALSVMVLVTFGLVYGGVMQGLDASQKRGGADIMAVPSDSVQYIGDTELLYTGAPAPVYMDAGVVDRIASVEGVSKVSAQFYSQTLNSGCCSSNGETRLIGIDPATDFVVSGLSSDDAVAALQDHAVIIGSDVGGVSNDEIKILGESYKVLGTMASTGSEFDHSIAINIDQARALSKNIEGYAHYWEKYGDPAKLVSCVAVDVADDDDGTALNAVKGRINLTDGATPLVKSEVADKSQAQLESVFLLLVIAAVIMLVVTLLQLFARFYSAVWDRKAELALYRAVGASKSDLKKLILGEMGALVGSGLVVGVVLGFAAQFALLQIMQNGLAFPYLALGIPACVGLVALVVVVFGIVCAISIVWPLSQISKLDPSTAMQQGDID